MLLQDFSLRTKESLHLKDNTDISMVVFFAFSSFIADFSSFTCGGAGVRLAVIMFVHPAALIVTLEHSETFSQSRLRCSKCSG